MAKKIIDQDMGMELYEADKTDEEAAAICGCSKATYRNWRIANGLPSKHMNNKGPKTSGPEYGHGLAADARRARELGMTYGQFKASQYEPLTVRHGRKKDI